MFKNIDNEFIKIRRKIRVIFVSSIDGLHSGGYLDK